MSESSNKRRGKEEEADLLHSLCPQFQWSEKRLSLPRVCSVCPATVAVTGYRHPGVSGAGGERAKETPTVRAPFLRPAAEGSKGSLSAHTRCALLGLRSLAEFIPGDAGGVGERKTHHCFSGTLNSGVFLPTTIYFLFAF